MKSLTTSNSLRTPTPRDLQIYKAFVILNRDQASISMNLNISRARISQVVKKVKRWLAAGGASSDPEIHEHLAQENLSHATKRIRLLRIIDRANYAAEHQLPSQKTTKTRYHGTTAVWREETAVLAPEVNLPALRLLLSAVRSLDQLETRESMARLPGQVFPDSAAPSEKHLLASVFEFLCQCRIEAEAAGHFPRSQNTRQVIAENLRALIGPLASTLDDHHAPNSTSPSANIAQDLSAPATSPLTTTPDQTTTSNNALT